MPTLYVPGNVKGPSGGKTYNNAVTHHLREQGWHVRVRTVDGQWPRPSPWAGPEDDDGIAIVDGMIASAAPAAIRSSVARGVRVVVLVHMAVPADPSLSGAARARADRLEGAALHAASEVVTTSRWSARDLRERYGLAEVHVAAPGTPAAPLSPGSHPPELLLLGAMTPIKNQLMVLHALRGLSRIPWSARIVGDQGVDPAYVSRIRESVREFPPGRVTLLPAQVGAALKHTWRRADLCLMCSRTETYGLVVAEALARGVPAIVSRGTGAQEALGGVPGGCGTRAGAWVDPQDPDALARLLRQWLTDPTTRADWSRAARARREELPTWTDTAAVWSGLLARG